jgi:hypothetical protein
MKYLIIASYLFFGFLIGCKAINDKVSSYKATADIRLGSKFYSIILNEIGEGYVIRGISSYIILSLLRLNHQTQVVFLN